MSEPPKSQEAGPPPTPRPPPPKGPAAVVTAPAEPPKLPPFDTKAAVAVFLELMRRAAVEGAPLGLELLLTVEEEDALAGAKAFDASVLRSTLGYVLDHAPSSVLPDAGGHRPHVNVLIRLDDLENRARAGCLDFGGPVAPESLRMLCCDAAVVPVVMNGKGQPLDVGRSTRTIPDGLRRAVAARDRGCSHPGCGRPASWCEIHHLIPWEHGGETKLSNLARLCRVHHRQTHSTEWICRIRDGLPQSIPPKWMDFEQEPRRRALPHLAGAR